MRVRGLCIAVLAAGLSCLPAAAASASSPPGVEAAPPSRQTVSPASEAGSRSAGLLQAADFGEEIVSKDTRTVADWVAASSDNQGLPFMIIDKVEARVFMFDAHARLLGSAPALLGLGPGDDTVEGIGERRLATITPPERTTPAGRFVASLGHDFEQDILWVDYDSALSLHRVIRGQPAERRQQRLASPTPLDNRISYGCINVPAEFYDDLVIPAFTNTVGIVYILPENKTISEVFAMGNA